MVIYFYPDGSMDVRDSWDVGYKPPVGTLIYEPSDVAMPWVRQHPNGPHIVYNLPPECKAIELIYPREPVTSHKGNVKAFLKQTFEG